MNTIYDNEISQSLQLLNWSFTNVNQALSLVKPMIVVGETGEKHCISKPVSDNITEIQEYIKFLITEKNISREDLYSLNQNMQMQKLYDSLGSVGIEKFIDGFSYNMWKNYIKKGNCYIEIKNDITNTWSRHGSFSELSLGELTELESGIHYSNHASLQVKIGPETQNFIKH